MKKQKSSKNFTVSGEEMIQKNLFMAAVSFGLVLVLFLGLVIVSLVKTFLL